MRQNSEYWKRRLAWPNYVKKLQFQYLVTTGNRYQVRPDGEDGWWQITLLCREYVCSRVFPQAKPLGAIPAGTFIGPISEVHIVKILDEYGLEVAIPSICKPGDVTYVVISRETERFVNEIHTHEAETRSSRTLLENLQESKESMSYKQREVTTSPKETWVAWSTWETRAGFLNLVPNKASIYTRKTIPRNEKKWITIHAESQTWKWFWQYRSPKLSQPCCVIVIRTNESLMDRDIRRQWNPYCWEGSNEMESKISLTKCGYKRSLKAAPRQ